MICPKCMATNDADADKCRRCGSPLGAGNKCPHCGSKISTPVKFCTNCVSWILTAGKYAVPFRNINGKRKVLHPLREKSKIGANKR